MNQNRVNHLLQAALNATVNGVLITDNTLEDNPIIFVNPGFEQMTGYQTEEILGQNCRFLQGKDTNREAVARLRSAVQEGKSIRLELLNYKKDGTPFWNDLAVSPVKDETGRVTHFIGVQADVTDRKEKEKAHLAQLMAENIVDTLREPLVVLNEDLTVHSVNQAFCRVFQTSREEITGQNLYELEGGYLGIPALKMLIENILPQKNPFEDFLVTYDFPRLGHKTLLLNARRLERNEERPEYILLAIEDITRWKESESARFQSEERSRFIIEGLKSVAVITTDVAGNITRWNPGAEQIIGYADEEIVGQNISRLWNAEDAQNGSDAVEKTLRLAMEQGQAQSDRWMVRKDGSQFFAMSILSVLQDESGNFQGFANLIHDQTERKRLEEQLAQRAEELADRDRAKDQFLAMLGHELRNPLAAIANATNVAQMLSNQENLNRPLEIVDRQVDHMNRLVSDLLDVARVTQGKITLDSKKLAWDDIVKNVCQTLQRQADAKGLNLVLHLDSHVFVDGDALRLEQIVSNLITNAIKYTQHGEVTIRLEAQSRQAVFTVSDTGMGIDPELLPRLFDLFAQAERSLARSEGGLGIGLTIVRQLVELHGGTIEVQSEGIDRGSVFRVLLPLADEAKAVEPRVSDKDGGGNVRLKVLVVEDHPDIAEMMTMMLQLWNYQTFITEDGEEAVAMAKREQPHIVLLDIGLPGLNGYQVAQELRKQFTSKEMKLVALTGYALESDVQRAKDAGFDFHLPKPLELNELKQLLTRFEGEMLSDKTLIR